MIALAAPVAISAGLTPCRKAVSGTVRRPLFVTRGVTPARQQIKERNVVVRIRDTDSDVAQDFDSILNNLAEKFENSENKAAVIGYSALGLGAFVFAEWLIHLPGLNVLLGFPVQLVGLLTLPWLTLRYFVDGNNVKEEIGDTVEDIWKRLPGKK